MKKLALALVLLTSPAAAQAVETAVLDPTGTWMRGDGNAEVEIALCGDDFCATNIWVGDTSEGEDVGDVLVMSVTPTPEGALSGTAYDRKRDLTVSMTITGDADAMSSEGCVLGGVICQTATWTRTP